MIKLWTVIAVALLAGCGDETKKTEPEETADAAVDSHEELRARDRELANGAMPRLPGPGEAPKSDSIYLPGMESHPFRAFFVPEGSMALDYFGKFWQVCDLKGHKTTQDRCDQAVEDAIERADTVGITVTQRDLIDPNYWAMHRRIYKMKQQDKTAWLAKPENKNNPFAITPYTEQMYEKEYQLLRAAGGK